MPWRYQSIALGSIARGMEQKPHVQQHSIQLNRIEDLEIHSGAHCVVLTHSHDLILTL